MQTVATAQEWKPFLWAQRRLGISHPTLRALINKGLLSERRVPLGQPRVLASDVERLAEQSTRWAGA